MKTTIQSDMTSQPVSIAGDVAIGDAQEVMRSWGMRHLPVIDNDKLVGVISDRDIMRAFALHKSGKTETRDVMTSPAYHVSHETSLAVVAKTMAEKKIGSAIVTDNDQRVVGIFTTTDALNLLSRILNEPSQVDYRLIQLKEYLARQKQLN